MDFVKLVVFFSFSIRQGRGIVTGGFQSNFSKKKKSLSVSCIKLYVDGVAQYYVGTTLYRKLSHYF